MGRNSYKQHFKAAMSGIVCDYSIFQIDIVYRKMKISSVNRSMCLKAHQMPKHCTEVYEATWQFGKFLQAVFIYIYYAHYHILKG